jgi:DNA mismatch repair protein PMS2
MDDAAISPESSRERVLSDNISVSGCQDEPTRLTEMIDLTEVQNETEESQVADSEVTISYEEFVSRKEVVKSLNGVDKTLRFDLPRVSGVWRRLSERPELRGAPNSAEGVARDGDKDVSPVPLAFSADQDDKAAEATLSRVIDKTHFGNMDIVGQFNRGFIVTRRRQGLDTRTDVAGKVMDDLFIVDQHAADEKYNFETLQQTTKINSQRLLRYVFAFEVD